MPFPARARVPLLLIALSLLAGCASGADDTGTGWDIQTDTLPGGISRVVNTPPTTAPQANLRLVEDLRIGALDGAGPDAFGQIKGIVATAAGQIAVLDAQAQEIRVFDADGAHLVTHGRSGDGPGEYRGAYGLMLAPNGEIWVPDHSSNRMSMLDPVDGFLRSNPMTILSRRFIWGGAMLDDGRVVKPSITLGPPRARVLRIYSPEMAMDSLVFEESSMVPQTESPRSFYYELRDGDRMVAAGYIGVPFFQQPHQLHHPSGDLWSSNEGLGYQLVRQTLAEDTTLVVETRRSPRPVPAQARDSAIAAIEETLRERGAPLNQDWNKIPTEQPMILGLAAGVDGAVWVRTGTLDQVEFDIYSSDGIYESTVETEIPFVTWFRPIVTRTHVYGVVTDEFDVNYVVRARVERAETTHE